MTVGLAEGLLGVEVLCHTHHWFTTLLWPFRTKTVFLSSASGWAFEVVTDNSKGTIRKHFRKVQSIRTLAKTGP